MKVYVGSDHNGFYIRLALMSYLERAGYEVFDAGDKKLDPEDDFPLFAEQVVNSVLLSEDSDARGVLVCGSGQGMCMAANRFKGIRAALGYDRGSILAARHDDNANILCLAADTLKKDEANVLTETFLNAAFADTTRFRRRLRQLDDLPH